MRYFVSLKVEREWRPKQCACTASLLSNMADHITCVSECLGPAVGLTLLPELRPEGYELFGFTRDNGAIVYREWAPAAQSARLIGDFNGWQGTPLDRDDFGVWSVRLPDGGFTQRK